MCGPPIAYTAGVSAAHEHINASAVHFYERVYALVARVPAGCVTTYGDLALALGWPRHARLVGYALARCPDDIPVHRVVNLGVPSLCREEGHQGPPRGWTRPRWGVTR